MSNTSNLKKTASSNSLIGVPVKLAAKDSLALNALKKAVHSVNLDDPLLANPVTEVSQLPGGGANGNRMNLTTIEETSGKMRVLDRMARIVVNQKPDEPCIFSYHYEYKEHCDFYGFIDPLRAKRQEEKERLQKARIVEGHLAVTHRDGDDDEDVLDRQGGGINEQSVSEPWEESESGVMGPATSGKNRFDTLLKSLIARIEFNNTLAPIQEYGRHHQKAAHKLKQK
jgi:hypothetical protein